MAMSVTVLLTGQLPFVLLVAAGLALSVSLLLLWLYRRAVLRSMRIRRGGGQPVQASGQEAPIPLPPPAKLDLSVRAAPAPVPNGTPGDTLFRRARSAPWRAAAIYGLAGAIYALTMMCGWILATRDEFVLLKCLWLFWGYLWPAVLTINLVVGSTRRLKAGVVAAYFAALALLAAIALARNPGLTIGQLIVAHWLWTNGPATVLSLAFLARRIRAVGPLVVAFSVIAVLGSQVGLDLLAANERVLRSVAGQGFRLGLSGSGVFYGLILVGFVAFGVLAWPVLGWIRRRYDRKRISDESLTFDSLWFLFGIVQSLGLVFEGWPWIFTGLVAFLAYKLTARIGFGPAGLYPSPGDPSPRLLLLRVFSLGKRSERLFDAVRKHWLRVGSIRLIAGPDLATTTVEPHEFLDFLSGKLARRFIDGPKTLDLRLSEMDTRADWDGRFRTTDFFCHDDTWRMVLSRLVGESDAVLMDLRGFSQRNAGCQYEIEELLNLADLHRVVLVMDDTTDSAFLERTAHQAWNRLRTTSPNRRGAPGTLTALRLAGSHPRELHHLLRTLCAAATPKASHTVPDPAGHPTP
jgi:hypothetical protein